MNLKFCSKDIKVEKENTYMKNLKKFESFDEENNNTFEDLVDEETKDSNGYFWGVFSNERFFIADKKFNVIFETNAFNRGRWSKSVLDAFSKYGIDPKSEMRTSNNIDDLKRSIELTYKIQLLSSTFKFPENLKKPSNDDNL